MNVFDEIAKELFGDSSERGRYGPPFASDYYKYEGDPMNVDQLKRIQQSDPYRSGNPNGVRGNQKYDDLYEILEDAQEEWPDAEIIMDGTLGTPDEWWVGTVYVFYDDIEDTSAFEEWAVLSFKSTLRDETKGVNPSDPRLTFGNECFRYTDSDDHLLATTDECQFREYDGYGKCLRLWWDD